MNVEPTAMIVDEIAETMDEYAKRIRFLAATMREEKDLSIAGEVVRAVSNCMMNLRLDLLCTMPLREQKRCVSRLEIKDA